MVACCLGFDEFLSWLLVVGKREIIVVGELWEHIPIEGWMIDWLSIVETDKVIHTVKTDMVKLVVDIESCGKSSDEIDKETVSFGELQLKQEDLSCVHALNGLHLHEIRVVPSMDKSKITRKQSKASNTLTRESKDTKPKPKKSSRSQSLAISLFYKAQVPSHAFPKVIYNLKERKERQGPNVQTSQSSTVLTVEKGAGTPFTIHRLPRFHCHGKIKGQIEIKGCVGQFKEAQAQNQGQISLIKGILILVQAQRPRNQW
ncbi:hypothetical protein Tco_0550981 [Tanacetum coccineum]